LGSLAALLLPLVTRRSSPNSLTSVSVLASETSGVGLAPILKPRLRR
jgi:hypothetical protein